jgi:hypothetical protein
MRQRWRRTQFMRLRSVVRMKACRNRAATRGCSRAHIGRFPRQENVDEGRQAQHRRASSTERTASRVPGSQPRPIGSVVPAGITISIGTATALGSAASSYKRTAKNRKGMGRRSVVEFWGPTGGAPPQGSNLRALEPRGHARFVFRARIPRGGRFRFVVSAGDIDSGTGKGTAFRAFSVGFRYFGEKCREASVLRRGYRKAKGIICGNVESGRKSFGA